MSARRNTNADAEKQLAQMRGELQSLKDQARMVDAAGIASQNVHTHEFDQLSPTEQSAASLGVHPSSWKPIAFLNNKHYDSLIKANMLDDALARRIEVRIKPHVCASYLPP